MTSETKSCLLIFPLKCSWQGLAQAKTFVMLYGKEQLPLEYSLIAVSGEKQNAGAGIGRRIGLIWILFLRIFNTKPKIF